MLAKTKTECFNLQMKITFVYALLFSLIALPISLLSRK